MNVADFIVQAKKYAPLITNGDFFVNLEVQLCMETKNNVNLCVQNLPLHKRHGDVTNDFLGEGVKIYISFHKSLQFPEAPTALKDSASRVTSNI